MPADMIAGQPLGIGRTHHICGLAVKRRRKLLHADFAIRRYHDADRLAVDFRHQRLQHALRFNPERLGGLQADPVGIGIVVVGVQREFDTPSGERQRRARVVLDMALSPRRQVSQAPTIAISRTGCCSAPVQLTLRHNRTAGAGRRPRTATNFQGISIG